MSNKAREIIIPNVNGIFRTIFLYVGQGEATLLVIPDGENYLFVLIDVNEDKELEGIDIVRLLDDLLDQSLDVFINTHPHKDHIRGIKSIYDRIGIDEVWHSGHIPGGNHKDSYNEFKSVLDELGENRVYLLKGSREENMLDEEVYELGNIDYNILAPAEYVSDEIDDEKPDERYKRIHEQCGVIRFSYGEDPGRILITGDSNVIAWSEHITEYHKERLASNVMSASHHGSRTFFKENEENEEYLNHIENIKPKYLIVSAPTKDESPHEHPHDDAIELYKKYIDEDNMIHLGNYKNGRCCVIVDINMDGNMAIEIDEELYNTYKFKKDDNGGKEKLTALGATPLVTKLDNKPMGKNELD